jgi:hypothetical protein
MRSSEPSSLYIVNDGVLLHHLVWEGPGPDILLSCGLGRSEVRG